MDIADSSVPIARAESYTNLQPLRARNIPKWKQWLYQADIFAFLPTPRTYPVSTKRSLMGSILLFVLFFGYMVYSFVDFLVHNVPRVNEFSQIDNQLGQTQGPEIAFQFLWGDPFKEALNDPTYFTITMQKVVKYKDPSKPDNNSVQIPLNYTCQPDWISKSASNWTFFCPIDPLILSGQLYQTEEFVYPRIQIDYCQKQKRPDCKSEEEIRLKVAGGRFFLYIKSTAPEINYVTGKDAETVPFQVFQYFLVPELYNRAEIVLQKQNVSVTGDYLTSFSTKKESYLAISNQYLYISNVTVFSEGRFAKGFQIFLRMDQEIKVVQVVKVTIVDIIAKWGAFWGVLFAGFAFYFLRFNQTSFYNKYPDWAVYDETEQRSIIQHQTREECPDN